MKVLIACECSGVVREAFKELGYDAWSCDLEDTDIPSPNHHKGDVLEILNDGWDLMIAHPPCTHLAISGAAWFKRKKESGVQDEAVEFFMKLANADIPHIAVENPVGIMSTRWRRPDQIIQPWLFGDSVQKKTCLWFKNLPMLEPTNIVDPGEFYTYKSGKRMPKWFADAWKLKPKERAKLRSQTFPGFAKAMAQQWGKYVEQQL